MPLLEPGQSIEDIYRDHIRKMTPAEKIAQAFRMTATVRNMVRTNLRSEHPDWDERTLKFELARRCYWNDPKALKLLDEDWKKGQD